VIENSVVGLIAEKIGVGVHYVTMAVTEISSATMGLVKTFYRGLMIIGEGIATLAKVASVYLSKGKITTSQIGKTISSGNILQTINKIKMTKSKGISQTRNLIKKTK